MDAADFSKSMDLVYREALQNADAIVANAARIRQEAEHELSLAKEIRSQAEKDGERITLEYLAHRQIQLMEATRAELLHKITMGHLERGRRPEDIVLWLNVPLSFVEDVRRGMQRALDKGSDRLPLGGNPGLRYENSGRGGTVHFANDHVTFDMWWEFAGGGAIAIVDIPTKEHWQQRTHLALDERDRVIEFIGDQILKDQLSGSGYFVVGEAHITFYK